MMRTMAAVFLFGMMCCAAQPAPAADVPAPGVLLQEFPPGLIVPPGARLTPDFDVDRATQAYMNLLSAAQRARSDAYFEGGYWLQLWSFLYSLGVAWLLLSGRRSARLRDWCERLTQRRWLQTFVYSLLYLSLVGILTLPWTIYTGFIREHAYGLANQNFAAWFGEQLTDAAVSLVVGAVFLVAAYSFVARFVDSWWIWLSGFTLAFLLLMMLILPVWILPLFNDYRILGDGPVKAAVLGMARANGVPAANVYWFDASRQSNRVSANVSGFLGTTRVSLNDNLLNKTSLPEIKAVMGHELGHYVLHHPLRGAIYSSLVFAAGFAFVHTSGRRLIRRWRDAFGLRDVGAGGHVGADGHVGAGGNVGGVADLAALPLLWALFATFLLVATPVLNSISRQQEAEADLFGLNTARQPYGFSMAAMRLSSYRKMQPGALEEFLFYDHPSGHTRIHDSMRWLRENPSAAHE